MPGAESPGGAAPGTAWRRAAGLLLTATAAAAAAGCAGPERSEPPVSEDVYVDVMARLAAIRVAADSGRAAPEPPGQRPDSLPAGGGPPAVGPEPGGESETLTPNRADSLRSAVLERHGVARRDLETFARVVGDEPGRMEALWKRIAARADSLARAGWPVDTATSATDSAAGRADSLPSGLDVPPNPDPDSAAATGGRR